MYAQKIQSLPHFFTVGWSSLRNINWYLRLGDFRKEGRTFTALSVGEAWFRFSVIPLISEKKIFRARIVCTEIVYWRDSLFIQRVLISGVFVAVVEKDVVSGDSFRSVYTVVPDCRGCYGRNVSGGLRKMAGN